MYNFYNFFLDNQRTRIGKLLRSIETTVAKNFEVFENRSQENLKSLQAGTQEPLVLDVEYRIFIIFDWEEESFKSNNVMVL